MSVSVLLLANYLQPFENIATQYTTTAYRSFRRYRRFARRRKKPRRLPGSPLIHFIFAVKLDFKTMAIHHQLTQIDRRLLIKTIYDAVNRRTEQVNTQLTWSTAMNSFNLRFSARDFSIIRRLFAVMFSVVRTMRLRDFCDTGKTNWHVPTMRSIRLNKHGWCLAIPLFVS